MYKIKKLFLNGILKDIVISEITKVQFEIDKTYSECYYPFNQYKIINISNNISE